MPENHGKKTRIEGKGKLGQKPVIIVCAFFLAALLIAVLMSFKNTADLRAILENSVKSQLIAVSLAARGIIDVDKFSSYNRKEDIKADQEAYNHTLKTLRRLRQESGAQYIYALKRIDGKYYFIFDTDTEDETIFIEYELSPVHGQAFLGRDAAGIMNVEDQWGSYNTGAVPIWKDNTVIGIVCTDIQDRFMKENARAALTNFIVLIAAMALTVFLMFFVMRRLMLKLEEARAKLYHLAHYDMVTGIPNRQYLIDYLSGLTAPGHQPPAPFAVLFIDLDNFKAVNDNAGHDTGDELLRYVAACLSNMYGNSKAFRPTAGILNISARVGGDEFLQVVPGVSTEEEAAAAARKVLDDFRSSHTFDRFIEKYNVGLSIGVSIFPYHSANYNVLIKYADIAMYQAKQSGKNSYRVYKDGMREKPA
ncbi:MAG: GGDEF domain-containing protein [Desulfarculales bacterium]|jgi:diguanylate cyclase (GGDEF)-like protein|nr:GGDEF domain-containing protein [Desulfarculales bacterium]